jgi:hypothetical protein
MPHLRNRLLTGQRQRETLARPGWMFVLLFLLVPVQGLCQNAARDFDLGPSGQSSVALSDQSVFEVTINGKGPFRFFFDTGANVNILDPEVIAQLNLPAGNIGGQITGLSGGPVDAKPFHVSELRIGDLVLHDQDFFNIPIPLPKSYAIAGAIGYELFSRILVKTDYEHHQLVFFDPARFPYTGSGQKLDLQPDPQSLVVKARIDGNIGNCVLDTAFLGEIDLTLNGWFVHRHRLVHPFARHYHGVFSQGADGTAPPATLERVREVCLGDACVPRVITELNDGKENSPYAGRIGLGLLQRFTSTIDWQHHTIYIEKTAAWNRPAPYNQTGLDTDFADVGDALIVSKVFPHSPASRAHVKVGDRILLIDNHPPAPDWFWDDPAFLKAAGTHVILTVQRGKTKLQLTLILKDIL